MRLARSIVCLGFAASFLASSAVPASAQFLVRPVWLQSFLSPGTDSFLTTISFGGLFSEENTIEFELRQFNGMELVGPSLFFYHEPGALPLEGSGSYLLHPNVPIAPNTMLAIVLGVSNPFHNIGVSAGDAASFANGALYTYTGTVWREEAYDIGDFAVTFAPTVAPEPTTVTLLATGLLCLCVIQHRSRRRRPIHKTSAA